MNDKIAALKSDVLTLELRAARDAAYALVELEPDLSEVQKKDVFEFLCKLLDNDDIWRVNIGALAIREMKSQDALEPLLRAAEKPQNLNSSGTIVWAMQNLDCSNHLIEIFKIFFYQGWESKWHACEILSEQIFSFTKQDILEIQAMWEDLKLHPERGVCFETTKEGIQKSVEGYLPYLNK